MIEISKGPHRETPVQQATVNDPSATYGKCNSRFSALCKWLKEEATPEQIAAVEATARAVGFQDTAKNNSRSGRAESRSYVSAA